MSWTPERVDLLKKLWSDGLSASQIAMRIPGVTRNSVIGKVFRLGLSGRATTSRKKSHYSGIGGKKTSAIMRERAHHQVRAKVKAEAPEFMRAPREPFPDLVLTDVARVSFAELEPHHCRFIPGDPKAGGKLYCGGDAVPGLPYCEAHALRCFAPPRVSNNVRPLPSIKTNSFDMTLATDELLGDRVDA